MELAHGMLVGMLHPEDPALRDGTAAWALRFLVEQVALVLGTLAAMLPPKDPCTRGWCRGVGAWALQIPTEQVALALGTLAVMLPPEDPVLRDGTREAMAANRPPRRSTGSRSPIISIDFFHERTMMLVGLLCECE